MPQMNNGSPWRETGPCPICGAGVEIAARLAWPRFRHSDWSVIGTGPWTLLACPQCGISGAESPNGFDLNAHFTSRHYTDRDAAVHHVRSPGADAMIARPQYQADIMVPYLPACPTVLDIGCFDGGLLRAFRARYPAARLVGYDVSERLARFFPPSDRIGFATDESAWAAGPFDLIVFSHSLQYFDDPVALLRKCATNLSSTGRLFIQVPDLGRRPTSIALGDVYYHFSRMGLTNLLSLGGFDSQVLESTGFTHDLVIIASRVDTSQDRLLAEGAPIVAQAVRALDAMAQKTVARVNSRTVNVLGTTIDAAFVGGVLGDKLADFIDEAPCPVDARLLGRPIRHPRTLAANECTVVPFGSHASVLLQRLQAQYNGEFILI
jgi:SAM-dependent methyltransferase